MRSGRVSTAACAALVAGVLALTGCGTQDPLAVPSEETTEPWPWEKYPPTETPTPSAAAATPTATPTPTPTPTPTATEAPDEPADTPEPEPTRTTEPEPEESQEPEPTEEPEPSDEPDQPVGGFSEREQEVLDLTNEARADEGCEPLRADDRLHEAAVLHSEDMAERDYFDHVTPEGVGPGERAERAGYDGWGGENIAWGYRSAEDVVEGWMDSPGHRKNILNCDFVAIGVGEADSDRGPYWTQTFGYE
ncbi:CAP domain-containing protein [Jiangella mangrovi]|uniref:Uncharacterized protein YkwD n=1 Tax=Jiangella mangrovi TaxID=1524084 RepID=A0A7W9LKB8_9ACTN|nr:CAP domain-containing protein [Jiangella mangrovi]MBB5786912.1 uncharacterized protein YkwD [Jiangella mangrovi]